MEYATTLEAHLGAIVFGPEADTLEGMQWAAAKLRQAATLLEYRFAIERRYQAQQQAPLGPPITGPGAFDDSAQQGQQLAPAKRKRKHRATRTSNGAADHGPGLAAPPHDPLFPPEGAIE